MKSVISTPNAPAAIGPYSQAVSAGELIITSGQLPIDPLTGNFPSEDIKAQTKQSLDNVKAVLEAAGLTMDNIVKTTVFLKNMGDFTAMNEIYSNYFADRYPARSAVEVAELPKGAKIEIEAIAHK